MKTSFRCAGCGATPPADALPYRCPNAAAGDDVDHVLVRTLSLVGVDGRDLVIDPEANPFVRFRELLSSHARALQGGLTDGDFVTLVRELDTAIATLDGHGFVETPFRVAFDLGTQLGLTLWLKDETGNVAGSHKARHLMGVALDLAVRERLGEPVGAAPLAIASCGNAALAAAVVARAAGRSLAVFIPTDANPTVVARLRELAADITVCERTVETVGDPCYGAFRKAVDAGAIPFCVQGTDCGVTIEGGQTAAWEMAAALSPHGEDIDHVFVQVGGGAWGTALLNGFREAVGLDLIHRMPALHCVQTEGCHPVVRAWDLVTEHAYGTLGRRAPARRADRARELLTEPTAVAAALTHARTHRSAFMWPWTAPHSVAHGILDDETYDWYALVAGMIASGGFPVVVSDALVLEAQALARDAAGVNASATGAAALAGVIASRRAGDLPQGRSVAVALSGVQR